MLDKNTEIILKTIQKLSPNGYKLFVSEDFSVDNVEEGIDKLAVEGYIVLKYSFSGEYLLSLSRKGMDYFKEKNDKLIFKSMILKRTSLCSFLGAFIGGVIVHIIFILIRWLYA